VRHRPPLPFRSLRPRIEKFRPALWRPPRSLRAARADLLRLPSAAVGAPGRRRQRSSCRPKAAADLCRVGCLFLRSGGPGCDLLFLRSAV